MLCCERRLQVLSPEISLPVVPNLYRIGFAASATSSSGRDLPRLFLCLGSQIFLFINPTQRGDLVSFPKFVAGRIKCEKCREGNEYTRADLRRFPLVEGESGTI